MPKIAAIYNKARFFFIIALVLAHSPLNRHLMAHEVGEEELIGPQSEVVAVVNGQNLTRQELSNLLIESFGEQGLDVLIRRVVIYQQADKLGITVDPEEVSQRLERLLNREINTLLKARGLEDEEQLRDELGKMGMDLNELKERMSARLRTGMEVEILAEKIVETTVTVTDEDLKKAYEREYGEKIEASQVVVSTRQEAEEILEKVQSGADFETLARNESIDRLSAAVGGRMKPFSPSEGFFGPKVAYLEAGQISDIIKTDNGYHILKILNKRERSSKDFEEVTQELEKIVKRQKVKKRLGPWLASILERADITKYLVIY
ncbi:MAG: peptidylprolyl isomerase [Candidatus Brocadiales bacterium]